MRQCSTLHYRSVCLSVYIYVFMFVCVWCNIEDALSVIVMRVTADKSHTHGALWEFVENSQTS